MRLSACIGLRFRRSVFVCAKRDRLSQAVIVGVCRGGQSDVE